MRHIVVTLRVYWWQIATCVITVRTIESPAQTKMFKFFNNDQDLSPSSGQPDASGQVRFDDRGNAIYAWRDAKLEEDSRRAEKMRERALFNPSLSLVNDDPAPGQTSARNDRGSRLGYNPYESGQLIGKPKVAKKRDMHELSKWIEMKRRLAAQSPGNASKE
jgi:hypothetical protein